MTKAFVFEDWTGARIVQSYPDDRLVWPQPGRSKLIRAGKEYTCTGLLHKLPPGEEGYANKTTTPTHISRDQGETWETPEEARDG